MDDDLCIEKQTQKGTTLVRTSVIYKKAKLNISKIIRIISFNV
jgi:hypothetical protein